MAMDNSKNTKIRIAEIMPVGLVVERRKSGHPWQDHTWHVVGVLPDYTDEEEWRILQQGEGWVQYYAGSRDIELFRKETEGYKVNLSNDPPLVYVVLRPGEDEDDHEVIPFIATVCPYEAQDYQDTGEEQVEGVAMPPEIAAWVQDFVNCHHVDEPFVKRKRKKKTAEDSWGKRRPERLPDRGRNG